MEYKNYIQPLNNAFNMLGYWISKSLVKRNSFYPKPENLELLGEFDLVERIE